MPKYTYIAKDKSGKTFKNVMDAPSQASVIEKLQKQDYYIVGISELTGSTARSSASVAKRKKAKKFSHKKVKMGDMMTFARQLATMLEAGVTLIRSLDVIHSQVQSEQLYHAIAQVRKNVEQGSSLSEALKQHPKVFNQFWTSLIEVGEASGTIPAVLNKLAFYMEQQAAFRSTIISGLIYPLILFIVSMGAVVFFALFVGPRFESIFKSMNADLPAITTILLTIFRFIKEKFLFLGAAIFGFIFALKQYIKTYQGRSMWERFMFRLPTFGEIYNLIIVERFCSQMAILMDAGVPILHALDITERLVDNNTCALIVSNIKEEVRTGKLLMEPMERSEFFPPMAVQMVMVGEETGELSKMLKHVSAYYQGFIETFMKRFATIVEPFMLVFMGAVIGTIVLAMFLPMFNISQLGGG